MSYRSRIFHKFLATAVLLIAATVLFLDYYLTGLAEQQEIDHAKQLLKAQANLLIDQLERQPDAQLEGWIRETGKRAQVRLTVIAPAGIVLADSEHDPETMENHRDRSEVHAAATGTVATAIRYSITLKMDFCYVAVPMRRNDREGYVLRLAVPLARLNEAVQAVRRRIMLASMAAAAGALAIAWLVSRKFTGRIRRLQDFAEGLVADRLWERLPEGPADELGLLSRSLNRMAEQLQGMVERQRLEGAQREAILASMVEGVLAVDADLKVTFCNRAFAELLGIGKAIHEATPLEELIPDAELRQVLTAVLVSGDSVRCRLQLPASEGRAFEVQASPLATVSRRGAVAILHDISDIERLERIRRDFVANVSHELRTPLTAIRGYAETLLDGALEDPENNRRFLEIIQANAMRLNNIASDLLTLSELEAGKAAAEPEPVLLPEVVSAALRTVEPAASLQDVRVLRGRVDPAIIRGDRTHLEQMLVNLLDNAIKFNVEGGQVEISALLAPTRRIRICVADTGIGIPASDIPRIFERFYRVDKARSREVGGTGLGLSIVRHIVDRLGGTIAVESQLARGSTFTVELPTA